HRPRQPGGDEAGAHRHLRLLAHPEVGGDRQCGEQLGQRDLVGCHPRHLPRGESPASHRCWPRASRWAELPMRDATAVRDAALRVHDEEGTMTQVLQRPAASDRLLTPRFVAVGLAALAYFTGDGVLIAVLPRYVTGPLGAGTVAVGAIVGAFSVSAFFLRPLAGGMGDRWGRRPLMMAGASLFAVSVLAYPVAPGPPTLALLRLLTGAGEALFFVGAVSAFLDLAPPERRGEAMSLASLALYVGIGAGPLLGEAALARLGFGA